MASADATPSPSTPTSAASDSTSPSTISDSSLSMSDLRTTHHMADVVIIGAGVLGSALATTLARAHNRSVLLLERSTKEPDRIVGELLQPGGVAALDALGLSACVDGIDAVPVHGYEVAYHGRPVHIPYAADRRTGARPQGRSFHHGRFVQRLRAAAAAEPNVTLVETTATGLVHCGHTGQVLGVEARTAGKPDCFFGALTVVADGYASKFRDEGKSGAVAKPTARRRVWGLALIDTELPRPRHGTVVLSDNAPVLLYQIGTHETRVLVDVPDGLESTSVARGGVKGHLRKVVLPTLPVGVQPAFATALDQGKVRSMPNSWLAPTTNRMPGFIVMGDALNMRHPLTGGGMTVALNDVVLLRELLSPDRVGDLRDTRKVLKVMGEFHWRRKGLTSVINILAQALYSLFAASGMLPAA